MLTIDLCRAALELPAEERLEPARRFEHQYFDISIGLGQRFGDEVYTAIEAIKASPEPVARFR